jgi:hypothetical protein
MYYNKVDVMKTTLLLSSLKIFLVFRNVSELMIIRESNIPTSNKSRLTTGFLIRPRLCDRI